MANHTCDGCGKNRSDVRTMGTDVDGTPDGPDMCFICRKEMERGRLYDSRTGKYVKGVTYVTQE